MSDCAYSMCGEKDCLHCYPVQKMDKPDYPPAGTWDVIDRHGEPRYVVEHDGNGGWWCVCQPDRPEDCYVLAASKGMLAALKECEWADCGYCPQCAATNGEPHQTKCLVGNAIAKAEGK